MKDSEARWQVAGESGDTRSESHPPLQTVWVFLEKSHNHEANCFVHGSAPPPAAVQTVRKIRDASTQGTWHNTGI